MLEEMYLILKTKLTQLKMVGEHQVYNASLALSALFNLRERGIIDIDNSIIKEALAESVWVGRFRMG